MIAARSIRKLSLDVVRPPHPITFDRGITADHLAFVALSLCRLNSRNHVLGLMGDSQGSSDHETLKLPPSSVGSGNSGGAMRPRVASPHAAVHIAMDRFVVSVSICFSGPVASQSRGGAEPGSDRTHTSRRRPSTRGACLPLLDASMGRKLITVDIAFDRGAASGGADPSLRCFLGSEVCYLFSTSAQWGTAWKDVRWICTLS